MSGALNYLRGLSLADFSEKKWNGMLAEVAKRLPLIIDARVDNTTPFPSRFLTTVSPWPDAPATLNLPKDCGWQVSVTCGAVNDTDATARYLRENDPRGWIMPPDYPAAMPGTPGYNALTVDRPLYEVNDPVCFALQAPDASGNSTQFAPTAAVIAYFQQDQFDGMTLYKSSVILTGSTGLTSSFVSFAPSMNLFRVSVGIMSLANVAPVGGAVELAQIWLARDPDNDPADDQIFVRQMVWWNLGGMILVPAIGFGLFVGAGGAGVQSVLDSAAQTLFWSQ